MKTIIALSAAANLLFSASVAAQEHPALTDADNKFVAYMDTVTLSACIKTVEAVASDLKSAGINVTSKRGALLFKSPEATGTMTCHPKAGLIYKAFRTGDDGQQIGPTLKNF